MNKSNKQQVVSPSFTASAQHLLGSVPRQPFTYCLSYAQARILFVSESNVCRSVLAEAIMRDLLEAAGMAVDVAVSSAGSRDYNVGDGPDPLLVAVAEELQLRRAMPWACAAASSALLPLR